jgi:hypothetical protein
MTPKYTESGAGIAPEDFLPHSLFAPDSRDISVMTVHLLFL